MKHFQVTIRESDNTKSVLVVPVERQSDIANFLKELGVSGKIEPINIPDPLKDITVTCGWGANVHAWHTFKWNAIISNNRCPSYPDCQG